MNRQGKPYTWKEERYVFRMAGHMSARQIAEKLGRTESSVRNFCISRKIRLSRRGHCHHTCKYPDDLYKACIALYDAGFGIARIREMVRGAEEPDYSTVYRWCSGEERNGIDLRS